MAEIKCGRCGDEINNACALGERALYCAECWPKHKALLNSVDDAINEGNDKEKYILRCMRCGKLLLQDGVLCAFDVERNSYYCHPCYDGLNPEETKTCEFTVVKCGRCGKEPNAGSMVYWHNLGKVQGEDIYYCDDCHTEVFTPKLPEKKPGLLDEIRELLEQSANSAKQANTVIGEFKQVRVGRHSTGELYFKIRDALYSETPARALYEELGKLFGR